MRLIFTFGIALFFLLLAVGGWFLYDTWNHSAQIVEKGEIATKSYSSLILELEDATKMTPLRKELLPIVCMKKVVHQEGYLLFKKIHQHGAFHAVTMLVNSSDNRKTKLNELMLAGLKEIRLDDCPEDFKQVFNKYSEEYKNIHSDEKTGLRDNLYKKIDEYEQRLIEKYGKDAEKALEEINSLHLKHTKP
jgi:hypothetical protein